MGSAIGPQEQVVSINEYRCILTYREVPLAPSPSTHPAPPDRQGFPDKNPDHMVFGVSALPALGLPAVGILGLIYLDAMVYAEGDVVWR